MRKSRKNPRKNKSRTRKNKCVYTDETRRIIGLMKDIIKHNKKHSKTKKSN